METSAHDLIRTTRERSGLTQAGLARAMGTTQSSIARLESAGSSPTLRTLRRVMAAMGKSLVLGSEDRGSSIDEAMISAHLRLTPDQRLQTFIAAYRNMNSVVADARRD